MREKNFERKISSAEGSEKKAKKGMKATHIGPSGTEKLRKPSGDHDLLRLERIEGSVDSIRDKMEIMLKKEKEEKNLEETADEREENSEEINEETMREVAAFLQDFEKNMYFVDYETIDDERIPKDNHLYLLVGEDEKDKLREELEKVGYEFEEKKGVGLEGEIGPLKIFFIYKEAGEKKSRAT